MRKVKITVLKKYFYEELANAYLTDEKNVGACPLLEEGDTFLYEGSASMPKDFCPWAWIDLYKGVSTLAAGGDTYPWTKRHGEQILCCTDGVRPVVFSLKALEETIDE